MYPVSYTHLDVYKRQVKQNNRQPRGIFRTTGNPSFAPKERSRLWQNLSLIHISAEVTINYVITDEANKKKMVCVDPKDIPVVALVDSDLMMGMPKVLCASTGMDARTHAIEGYITNGAWELSDMVELRAIELIAGSLYDSVQGDPKASETMALAQYIAGMGF